MFKVYSFLANEPGRQMYYDTTTRKTGFFEHHQTNVIPERPSIMADKARVPRLISRTRSPSPSHDNGSFRHSSMSKPQELWLDDQPWHESDKA